jgi:hypothetical protein
VSIASELAESVRPADRFGNELASVAERAWPASVQRIDAEIDEGTINACGP